MTHETGDSCEARFQRWIHTTLGRKYAGETEVHLLRTAFVAGAVWEHPMHDIPADDAEAIPPP